MNNNLLYVTRLFKNKQIKLICSGSMLGIKFAKPTQRTDVGSKNYLRVFPLDFKEFLIWTGNENLLDDINES